MLAATLRQINMVDALVGVALGELERALGALGRRTVVDHGALDNAARGAFAATNDDDLAPGELADKGGDL